MYFNKTQMVNLISKQTVSHLCWFKRKKGEFIEALESPTKKSKTEVY